MCGMCFFICGGAVVFGFCNQTWPRKPVGKLLPGGGSSPSLSPPHKCARRGVSRFGPRAVTHPDTASHDTQLQFICRPCPLEQTQRTGVIPRTCDGGEAVGGGRGGEKPMAKQRLAGATILRAEHTDPESSLVMSLSSKSSEPRRSVLKAADHTA